VPKLPTISGEELIKILVKKVQYSVHRQKGSHVILTHPSKKLITVPLHKEIKIGTLKGIIRIAELDEKELR